MTIFGTVPKEVPAQRSLDLLAPQMIVAVRATLQELEGGRPEWPFETLRTPARHAFLFGFGRDYDDGRGIVTWAPTVLTSWHGFGLAIDIVEKDGTPWDAPDSFWDALGAGGEKHGLAWGGRWPGKKRDRPHLQWGACPVSPTDQDRAVFRVGGMEAVWRKYGAV